MLLLGLNILHLNETIHELRSKFLNINIMIEISMIGLFYFWIFQRFYLLLLFQVLGKRLKYSGCYWPEDVKTLEEGRFWEYRQSYSHVAPQSLNFHTFRTESSRMQWPPLHGRGVGYTLPLRYPTPPDTFPPIPYPQVYPTPLGYPTPWVYPTPQKGPGTLPYPPLWQTHAYENIVDPVRLF